MPRSQSGRWPAWWLWWLLHSWSAGRHMQSSPFWSRLIQPLNLIPGWPPSRPSFPRRLLSTTRSSTSSWTNRWRCATEGRDSPTVRGQCSTVTSCRVDGSAPFSAAHDSHRCSYAEDESCCRILSCFLLLLSCCLSIIHYVWVNPMWSLEGVCGFVRNHYLWLLYRCWLNDSSHQKRAISISFDHLRWILVKRRVHVPVDSVCFWVWKPLCTCFIQFSKAFLQLEPKVRCQSSNIIMNDLCVSFICPGRCHFQWLTLIWSSTPLMSCELLILLWSRTVLFLYSVLSSPVLALNTLCVYCTLLFGLE